MREGVGEEGGGRGGARDGLVLGRDPLIERGDGGGGNCVEEEGKLRERRWGIVRRGNGGLCGEEGEIVG